MFEICAEGIFVTFPWWLENVKSRSKITRFSNERHFEIWFPKKRTITFFWSKLSKLHKKDPISHVATTFSLKQGETRTSHRPIPHPLNQSHQVAFDKGPLKSVVSEFKVHPYKFPRKSEPLLYLSPEFWAKFCLKIDSFFFLTLKTAP